MELFPSKLNTTLRLRQDGGRARLGLSARQVRRLIQRYREQGVAGMASGRRGRRPNDAPDEAIRLVALRFFAAETTRACMETLRGHLAAHGRPVALHSDRHGVFRVNRKDGEDAPTQFTRALGTLDIQPIHARTPQAKGRVGRANRTLQDRLVKEMRLRGIDGMEGRELALRVRRKARRHRPWRTGKVCGAGWTRRKRGRRRGRTGSRRRTILGAGVQASSGRAAA